MKNIPNLLDEYIKKKNISQYEMAARLGVTQGMVSKWRRGVAVPATPHYARILEVTKR